MFTVFRYSFNSSQSALKQLFKQSDTEKVSVAGNISTVATLSPSMLRYGIML